MKTLKKMMVLVLSILMVLGTTMVTSFAEEEKTITLTGGKAGHTYTLYQIFTGTVNTDGKTLENIQWGADAPKSLKDDYPTAAAAAKAIHDKNDARKFAQDLGLTGGTNKKVLTADGNVVFEGLEEGYYVLVDEGHSTTDPVEGDYDSAFVVKVVKDVKGELKGSGATSDKDVKDKEGNIAAESSDAVAYNIGDDVPFQLTATAADNVAAYKKYHITFQDKQSEGLDAPKTFTVNVLGKTFTVPATGDDPAAWTTENGTKITVKKVTPDSGNTFAIKVEFEPADTAETKPYLPAECNNAVITVDYTAKLNSSAEIGLPGNTNDMHITYSNNPEDEDGGDEGKTPDDTVKVFTYKTVVDKVDETGAPLEGAGFTIYMEVAEGTTGAVKGSDIQFTEGVEHSSISADKYYIVKAMTTVSGNEAQFEFEGLADGNYVLVETTIPEGYNPFKSAAFTISSTVTETEITTLTGGDPFTTTNPGEDNAVTAENGHKLESGELYAEIKNKSGQELPSTGGMGTTILYIIGGALVVICGIMLIAKKRAEK